MTKENCATFPEVARSNARIFHADSQWSNQTLCHH